MGSWHDGGHGELGVFVPHGLDTQSALERVIVASGGVDQDARVDGNGKGQRSIGALKGYEFHE